MIATYDLRTQPWSLGDMLVFLVATQCVSKEFEVRFVFDEYHRPSAFEYIPGNPGEHLQLMKDIALSIEGCVGVSCGGSSDWPEKTNEYLNYWLWNDVIYNFYLSNGQVPTLKTKYSEWAKAFREKNNTKGLIHIRKHKYIQNNRDAKVENWGNFVKTLEENVVVIGDVEIDGAINIKEPVGHQLALIETSKWMMASNSGPAMMAIFNKIPVRMFCDSPFRADYRLSVITDDWKYVFNNDAKFVFGDESVESLQNQYKEICDIRR